MVPNPWDISASLLALYTDALSSATCPWGLGTLSPIKKEIIPYLYGHCSSHGHPEACAHHKDLSIIFYLLALLIKT